MKAKKSLGQNFFVNKNLGDHIVSFLPNDGTVVEIGPGQGFFTNLLKTKTDKLLLIEKDDSLASILKEIDPNVEVFKEDFLSFDLKKLPTTNLTFFGSLPYNVSKPIIKKIIESEYFTNTAYFIVQKEVAEKYIYTKPFNSLSTITTMYADVKKLIDIKPDSFRPRPKVNSSLISLTPKKLDIKEKENLKELIQLAFKQPRKNLRNNLRNTKYEQKLGNYSEKRASELTLDEYITILNS